MEIESSRCELPLSRGNISHANVLPCYQLYCKNCPSITARKEPITLTRWVAGLCDVGSATNTYWPLPRAPPGEAANGSSLVVLVLCSSCAFERRRRRRPLRVRSGRGRPKRKGDARARCLSVVLTVSPVSSVVACVSPIPGKRLPPPPSPPPSPSSYCGRRADTTRIISNQVLDLLSRCLCSQLFAPSTLSILKMSRPCSSTSASTWAWSSTRPPAPR